MKEIECAETMRLPPFDAAFAASNCRPHPFDKEISVCNDDNAAADSTDRYFTPSPPAPSRSTRTREQLRLLKAAMRHVRQAQTAAGRVNVLTTAMPGVAREQANEARDQAAEALKCLEALEASLRQNP